MPEKICANCAWRLACKKQYTITSAKLCLEYTYDVTVQDSVPEEQKEENTNHEDKNRNRL